MPTGCDRLVAGLLVATSLGTALGLVAEGCVTREPTVSHVTGCASAPGRGCGCGCVDRARSNDKAIPAVYTRMVFVHERARVTVGTVHTAYAVTIGSRATDLESFLAPFLATSGLGQFERRHWLAVPQEPMCALDNAEVDGPTTLRVRGRMSGEMLDYTDLFTGGPPCRLEVALIFECRMCRRWNRSFTLTTEEGRATLEDVQPPLSAELREALGQAAEFYGAQLARRTDVFAIESTPAEYERVRRAIPFSYVGKELQFEQGMLRTDFPVEDLVGCLAYLRYGQRIFEE